MIGSTNAIIPSTSNYFTALDEFIRYSYDGSHWKRFNSEGWDLYNCAYFDRNTNILTVKASGFDTTSQTMIYQEDNSDTMHGFYPITDTGFYIKFMDDIYINYCLVGGGGGGASRKIPSGEIYNFPGGGGGAGGEVVYTLQNLLIQKDTIYKVMIGKGGAGGGNYWYQYGVGAPKAGAHTILTSWTETETTTSLLAIALGGARAGSGSSATTNNLGGAGLTEYTDETFYHRSASGGDGAKSAGNNGESGPVWPGNNCNYGGGGAGAGQLHLDDNQSPTYYEGGSGGIGGGGCGSRARNKGADGFGGGGGGANFSNEAGADGGTGVFLMKLFNT